MECISPIYVAKNDMVVPCGKCAFCTVTKRSEWATRLHYESRLHIGSKFVTLTYNDSHLTWEYNNPQLVKSDLQKFFKRLRKQGHKIRYYGVGEYGTKTYRPHYHVILFGEVPDNDIQKAWSECNKKTGKYYPIGHVHIGSVTQASIMYALGYIVNGKSWKYRIKRVPPFSLMSRKPGLGANYLTKDMIAWHKSDRKNYSIMEGKKVRLPRYYKTKIFSKIDQVRISVRDQKESFKKQVEWLRSPKISKMKNPVEYLRQQKLQAARRIKSKSKENLTI